METNTPGADTLNHLPVSQETFLDLVHCFRLSPSFVRIVLRGKVHLLCNIAESISAVDFNIRMDSSISRDLAMSTSYDLTTGCSYAVIHGCDDQDRNLLLEWIKITIRPGAHPFLMLALFSELQLRRDKRSARDNWKRLVSLYAQTGHYQEATGGEQDNDRIRKLHAPASIQYEPTLDYDEVSRSVLELYQSTGYLHKSILTFNRKLRQTGAHEDRIQSLLSKNLGQSIATEGQRITDRLHEMLDDYEGLLDECRLIIDGASLLTGTVWNLIVQRDNRFNRSIAADSRAIASDARRDSAAMKTIAVLTMIFLRGTFVSAIFAMPFFDWQATDDSPVVLHRFWIYWAVAMPLTATTLLVWTAWYCLFGSPKSQLRPPKQQQRQFGTTEGAISEDSSLPEGLNALDEDDLLPRLQQRNSIHQRFADTSEC